LITFYYPIIIYYICFHVPNFAFPGVSKVDKISAPRTADNL